MQGKSWGSKAKRKKRETKGYTRRAKALGISKFGVASLGTKIGSKTAEKKNPCGDNCMEC